MTAEIKSESIRWYALYTKSRNEKKVHDRLAADGYECFLPLQKVVRQWSDRKKVVEVPLINSYVFVRMKLSQRFAVLQDPGAVCFINFERLPAPVADRDIDSLKSILDKGFVVEVVPEALNPGAKVRVAAGELVGLEGELINYKGGEKVVIRIENIPFSLVVTVPLECVERI